MSNTRIKSVSFINVVKFTSDVTTNVSESFIGSFKSSEVTGKSSVFSKLANVVIKFKLVELSTLTYFNISVTVSPRSLIVSNAIGVTEIFGIPTMKHVFRPLVIRSSIKILSLVVM